MRLGVSAFYKFVRLGGLPDLRQTLQDLCRAHGIKGTILLAPEGINGTIAGEERELAATMHAIRAIDSFRHLESKESGAAEMPFGRMKVRIKKEIVTLGVPGVDPSAMVGRYVEPQDWNALISDADVVVIDTRNSFEVGMGSFVRAIDPGTRSFSEFPAFVDRTLKGAEQKTIAMFCTGGIRCEKATSYLLAQGFANVFHLKGGILKYLETVPEQQSLWRGRCFVFDERVALGHGLAEEPGPPNMNGS